MDKIPLFVTTEWLFTRLDDSNLRIIDATTFLGPPLHEAYMDVSSGREAYEKNHIQGAVFADLYEDFSETVIRTFFHSSLSREIYQQYF